MHPSHKSLVGIALQELDSDQSWDAIFELRMRGTPDTLTLVQRLAGSRNWRKRKLSMSIAAQLRQRKKGAPRDSVEYALEQTHAILLAGLSDTHPEVVAAAVAGFGHRPHPAALPDLVRLSNHANEKIRFDVAFALGSYSEPEAIAALLQLASDESDDVRDWATFGLGSLQAADGPEIRRVLWQNVFDRDNDVRGEALVGLANRKDERVIALLLERLRPDCQVYELEASEQLANKQLLPRLEALRVSVDPIKESNAYWHGRLLDALAACQE